MEKESAKIRISVRNIVEFILRSGDLDNRVSGTEVVEAMQRGSRLHRKIQKSMGDGYRAEVPLSHTSVKEREDVVFSLTVDGRADGIYFGENCTMIDEIKCVLRDVNKIEEPVPEHRSQAMCYAYFYAAKRLTGLEKEEGKPDIGIRLTYCNLESEEKQYFEEFFSFPELEKWYRQLTDEYFKWVEWEYDWTKARNASIKQLAFPFEYRPGQKDLVAGVYRSILRKKRLFIEAPTGVGKTISTVFPSVKAMGEGLAEKLFYTTAKTIVRTVAEEAFKILAENKLKFKTVTITAKEKICILEKPDCNPQACPRAKGHFDRVNDAVFDLLTHEEGISRELINSYAEKHEVCPFEMCLDVCSWADGIICDYNYVFDPNVYLKRFFAEEKVPDYILLADEAHNLVERAREMYSAELVKAHVLAVKRIVLGKDSHLVRLLETTNSKLLKYKRECDECELLEGLDDLVPMLGNLVVTLDEYLRKHREPEGREEVLDFYFELRHFMNMYELLDENYIIVADYNDDGEFRIRLMCMDPSEVLSMRLEQLRSAVFFSATLLPINYYREQLGGREEDYAIYAPSPFKAENRCLMLGRDVSTKYTRRSEEEYNKIADYIEAFVNAKPGNYMIFFPSYKMLSQLAEMLEGRLPGLLLQTTGMREKEREDFLKAFSEEGVHTGFCVLGGIFSEGIDLKEDCLIGAVIVGTGLPQVCNERELYRAFYDDRNGHGFDYSYLYNGMNKVEQAAGRVIRTVSDRGAILLLDERFLQNQYQSLFPREWFPYEVVDLAGMKTKLEDFWNA